MNFFFIIVIAASISLAQEPTKKQPAQQYYSALFTRGEHWDNSKQPHEQPHFADHGKNLKRLKDEGKIAIGSRFGEFGLVVFKSDNENEVRTFFANDSLVLKNILKMEIHKFNPFYKGCIE